jgi:hypothetical protein
MLSLNLHQDTKENMQMKKLITLKLWLIQKKIMQTNLNWVKEQRNSWHGVDYMYHGELEDFDGFYKRYCETLTCT